MRPLFAFILLAWTLVSVYHLSRFVLRRRFVSLVVALYPLGWIVFALRELRAIRNLGTIPFVSLAAVIGFFVVCALVVHELKRPRPFR